MSAFEKCDRCGFIDKNRYHVCVIALSDDIPVSQQASYENVALKPSRKMRDSQREAIAQSQRERWAELTSERDVKILERYSQGDISYTDLAEEFDISRSTVINVMKRAVARGLITPRAPGTNIRNGG